MNIGVFTFEKYHGKENIGSTTIRFRNVRDYWGELYPEDTFELFKHGKKYDAVIFQKVYFYEYAEGLDCIKILDICDPDWLSSWNDIVRMAEACDIVTVASQGLYDYLKKIIKKPLYLIKDRHKVENITIREKHIGDARNVLWYGYSHNAHSLRPVIKYIKDMNLKLTVVADSIDGVNSQFSEKTGTKCHFEDGKGQFRFVKHNQENLEKEFKRADFCVLPPNIKPEGYFKSDNKETLAMCYGLPVAKNIDDFRRFISADERNKELEKCREVRKEYDVRNSVKELKEVLLSYLASVRK